MYMFVQKILDCPTGSTVQRIRSFKTINWVRVYYALLLGALGHISVSLTEQLTRIFHESSSKRTTEKIDERFFVSFISPRSLSFFFIEGRYSWIGKLLSRAYNRRKKGSM